MPLSCHQSGLDCQAVPPSWGAVTLAVPGLASVSASDELGLA